MGRPHVHGDTAESALGLRLHLRRDLGRVRVCGLVIDVFARRIVHEASDARLPPRQSRVVVDQACQIATALRTRPRASRTSSRYGSHALALGLRVGTGLAASVDTVGENGGI